MCAGRADQQHRVPRTALSFGWRARFILVAALVASLLQGSHCLAQPKRGGGGNRVRRGLGDEPEPSVSRKLEWTAPVVYHSTERVGGLTDKGSMADRKRKIDLDDGGSKRRCAGLLFFLVSISCALGKSGRHSTPNDPEKAMDVLMAPVKAVVSSMRI